MPNMPQTFRVQGPLEVYQEGTLRVWLSMLKTPPPTTYRPEIAGLTSKFRNASGRTGESRRNRLATTAWKTQG
jgi:hypothetical protein